MPTAHQISTSFITYLKEQELYNLLPEIVQDLQAEVERNQDITVVAATPLEEADQKKIQALLLKKWGEHRVLFTVDPILLSGLLIKFKDQVIDFSGKSALVDLAEQLK